MYVPGFCGNRIAFVANNPHDCFGCLNLEFVSQLERRFRYKLVKVTPRNWKQVGDLQATEDHAHAMHVSLVCIVILSSDIGLLNRDTY